MNLFKNSNATCVRTAVLGLSSFFIVSASLAASEPDPQAAAPTAPAPTASPLSRFHILDMETSARFNYADQEGGGVADRGIQYRLRLKSRLDLLSNGATALLARAETGRGFNNSWNETAADLYPGQTIFNLKALGILQKVGPHVELSAGGIDFDHGEGSDETYVSHDGYMTGYRALLTGSAPWLPQKLSVTAAFVGEFSRPNVFSRFRMDRANYVQVLAQQNLTSKLSGSAELDAIGEKIFNRDALRYHHAGPIDEVVAEVVFRGSDRFTFAWSSELHKSWGPKWQTDLMYSHLPTRMYLVGGSQVIQNRGEIGLGKHLAGGASRKLTRDCAVNVFASKLLDRTPGQRWVAQAGVTYQFASVLNRVLR